MKYTFTPELDKSLLYKEETDTLMDAVTNVGFDLHIHDIDSVLVGNTIVLYFNDTYLDTLTITEDEF
jgi:hypothetical protein